MGALEDLVPHGAPDTVDGWRAAADALLSPPCCPFHRNAEITSRYAWLHAQQPTGLKWAAMAAIASHHVRRVLFPFRLDADGTGWVDLPRSLSRSRILTEDANILREVNNAIYADIFWVHLAYLSGGSAGTSALLGPDHDRAELLGAFEDLSRGRAVLEDDEAPASARREALELVWAGNLALLRHEQRVVVQPLFDRLSGPFARLASLGSTTTFEVRGLRQEVRYFTSFPAYSLWRGFPGAVRSRSVPSITRFEDRWRWLESTVVPRFRRLDGEVDLVARTLSRVVEQSRRSALVPCLVPR